MRVKPKRRRDRMVTRTCDCGEYGHDPIPGVDRWRERRLRGFVSRPPRRRRHGRDRRRRPVARRGSASGLCGGDGTGRRRAGSAERPRGDRNPGRTHAGVGPADPSVGPQGARQPDARRRRRRLYRRRGAPARHGANLVRGVDDPTHGAERLTAGKRRPFGPRRGGERIDHPSCGANGRTVWVWAMGPWPPPRPGARRIAVCT